MRGSPLPALRTGHARAPIFPDESARLEALASTGLLDSDAAVEFDALLQLATLVCHLPQGPSIWSTACRS